jgi:dipeptidyl aminopeptidase/acylaminoacyl peptidase
MDALLRLRHPTEVMISRDGTRLAYTITESAHEPGAGQRSRVWVAETGKAAEIVTSGPGVDRTPRLAVNGSLLAFTSDRDHAGRLSPFLLDLTTGTQTPIGDLAGSVEDLRWDRESVALLALVADPSADRAGSQGATRMGGGDDPAVFRPATGWRRLFRVGLDTDTTRRASPDALTVWEFDWDGVSTVAALVSDDPSENGWYDAALVVLDVESGAIRELLRSPLQLSAPRLSPDAQLVAVIEGLASDRGLVAGSVRIVDTGTGAVSGMVGGLEDVTTIQWRDADSLWCVGRRGLDCTLGVLARDGAYRELWSGGALLGNHFQPCVVASQTGVIAAAYEQVDAPPEVAVLGDDESPQWRPVTHLNTHLTAHASTPRAERVSWPASGGLEIEGLLLRPANATGPLPMIVVVHGGPTWAWSHEYAAFDGRGPLFAEEGYAVLLPNPRGSSGRGHRFVAANVGDLGGADLDDILGGVDECVRLGIADTDRVGLIGLSYGGYMTAWAVTQTRRFRAAVAMSCISDWISYHYTSNISRFDELFLTGDLRDPTSHYYQRAPVLYAHQCTTPTLIIHGELDLCTPVGQARELFTALMEAGVDTELVTYPREGHWPTEYDHQVDAWDRVRDWFARHLASSKPA